METDKSKARSFSVKGPVYWHVKVHCDAHKISMREFITQLITDKIGSPPVRTEPVVPENFEAPEPEKPVSRAKRPTFMQPKPLPLPQEAEGSPDYTPPIQLF